MSWGVPSNSLRFHRSIFPESLIALTSLSVIVVQKVEQQEKHPSNAYPCFNTRKAAVICYFISGSFRNVFVLLVVKTSLI